MRQLIAIVLSLLATPASAQVDVAVRTEKPTFLAGEPIFVLVEVKNVGAEPVAYGGASLKPPLTLAVKNGPRKAVRSLHGCPGADGNDPGISFVTHPSFLQPGAVTTFRYLLRGYRLNAGSYELSVSGHVDVGWRDPDPFSGAAPNRKHKFGDPVEGAVIDRTLPLAIAAGSQTDLEAAYKPYVAITHDIYTQKGSEAAGALFEMAPLFLEAEIVKLVRARGHEGGVLSGAAAALAEINSPSSRQELIAWFDRSKDLRLRSTIVEAIARTGHAENLLFLASLLPGHSAEPDDYVRRWAALGIGLIGGDAAVVVLRDAPESPNPHLNRTIVQALGNANASSAVPVLIERARGRDGYVSNDVCSALIVLTHRQWCDGSADVTAMQARWRRWWEANGARATIYRLDDCPDRSLLPSVK
jgi:HEAT repeats